ncbi:hypothetical protein EHYA_10411 [Embleya hyalina]|uniref:Uncharacterized protein n=1 Tax=Embleya hyalina TaxID=516124 RepID=A0A401Z704_9ACTN|nr:hypothetical protein EHYA_10411 [Embleya hyalina]
MRADTTHGRTPPIPGTSGAAGVASAASAGASSRTTCAFVPLIPNDDTPARRTRPPAGQATSSANTSTRPADQSTCGVGSSTCNVRGNTPCRNANTILITPATPAAAWVCPMFDFTDPNHNGRSTGRSRPYVANNACASIGSPSVVPVPCASTASTSPVDNPALSNACRITRCCDGPFGAVNPFDAPSWFTADPRTTANTECPWRRASDNRSTSTRPMPSAAPIPSAAAANALQRPSGDRPRWRENSTKNSVVAIAVTPPARARSHSPDRSAFAARCSATRDDEHAVSILTAGPSRPRTYETRPDAMLAELP